MKIRLIDVKAFAKRHDMKMVRKHQDNKVCYEFYLNYDKYNAKYFGSYRNCYGKVFYWASDDAFTEYNTREELNNA